MRHNPAHKYQDLRCQICGYSFSANRPHAKTCSPTCRKERSRIGQGYKPRYQLFDMVCEVCGQTFGSMQPTARTCGPACRQKAYRNRQEARRDQELRERVTRQIDGIEEQPPEAEYPDWFGQFIGN